MNKNRENSNVVSMNDEPIADKKPKGPNRRQFLGGVSGVAAAAATLGAVGLEPLIGGKDSTAEASVVRYEVDRRADASLRYRVETAKAEDINVPEQPDNGDAKRLRISAEITARPWRTTHLACRTWLHTRV
jgi:hypothetical protein